MGRENGRKGIYHYRSFIKRTKLKGPTIRKSKYTLKIPRNNFSDYNLLRKMYYSI